MTEKSLIDNRCYIDYLRSEPHSNCNFWNLLMKKCLFLQLQQQNYIQEFAISRKKGKLMSLSKLFDFIPVNKEIAEKGGLIRNEFGKSFNIGLADSLMQQLQL